MKRCRFVSCVCIIGVLLMNDIERGLFEVIDD